MKNTSLSNIHNYLMGSKYDEDQDIIALRHILRRSTTQDYHQLKKTNYLRTIQVLTLIKS